MKPILSVYCTFASWRMKHLRKSDMVPAPLPDQNKKNRSLTKVLKPGCRSWEPFSSGSIHGENSSISREVEIETDLLIRTRGIINTFGAFQTYYEEKIFSNTSPSSISWIGSIQSFLLLFVGVYHRPSLRRRIFLCPAPFWQFHDCLRLHDD